MTFPAEATRGEIGQPTRVAIQPFTEAAFSMYVLQACPMRGCSKLIDQSIQGQMWVHIMRTGSCSSAGGADATSTIYDTARARPAAATSAHVYSHTN